MSVERFLVVLKTARRRQVPAWQRLQAVRTIELYLSEVLGTSDSDLFEILQIPGRDLEFIDAVRAQPAVYYQCL